ncbi:unnamed protein product, partial [Prorocentrum cordatum]
HGPAPRGGRGEQQRGSVRAGGARPVRQPSRGAAAMSGPLGGRRGGHHALSERQ